MLYSYHLVWVCRPSPEKNAHVWEKDTPTIQEICWCLLTQNKTDSTACCLDLPLLSTYDILWYDCIPHVSVQVCSVSGWKMHKRWQCPVSSQKFLQWLQLLRWWKTGRPIQFFQLFQTLATHYPNISKSSLWPPLGPRISDRNPRDPRGDHL